MKRIIGVFLMGATLCVFPLTASADVSGAFGSSQFFQCIATCAEVSAELEEPLDCSDPELLYGLCRSAEAIIEDLSQITSDTFEKVSEELDN